MGNTMVAPNRKVVAGTIQQMGLGVYDSKLNENNFLNSIGSQILGNTALENQFFAGLVNRIGKMYLTNKNYVSALAHFKKGSMPFGTAIQDIYVNPIQGNDFTVESTLMTDERKDNILSVYYFTNSTKKFYADTSYETFVQAFTSWAEMDKMISGILQNLYDSQQIYEWNKTKQILGNDFNDTTASCGKKMKLDYYQNTFSQDFAKTVQNLSMSMLCPSAKYNNFRNYATANGYTNITTEPIITFSRKDTLNLIIRNDVMADVNIDVLSVCFNMNKAEFVGKITTVDNFGYINTPTKDGKTFVADDDTSLYDYTDYTIVENGKTYHIRLVAVVCDDSFIHIEDTMQPKTEDFKDASNLNMRTYLHSWQSYGLCPFANALYLYIKEEVTV